MSSRAKDKNGKLVLATDKGLDYNGTYYCLNSKCNAKMILKNYQSTNPNISPYFSSTKNEKHIEHCNFATSSDNINRYDRINVDVMDIFNKTLARTNEKNNISKEQSKENLSKNLFEENKKIPITNIKKLYFNVYHMDYNQSFGGMKIKDFLITKKNYKDFVKNNVYRINGIKLIEVSYCSLRYEPNKFYYIYCTLPYDRDCMLKPKIVLNLLKSKELFFELIDKLKKYKDNNDYPTLLILGEFLDRECEITSDKQIKFIKTPGY